jgi:hypothetical protein
LIQVTFLFPNVLITPEDSLSFSNTLAKDKGLYNIV